MKPTAKFDQLVEIMTSLRGPNGCPWDQEQTHESLRPYLIEEAYEVLSEIDAGNMASLKSELGDLMLQVVFHAQIAAERSDFTIDEVILELNRKLIDRHPHVFGDEVVEDAEQQTQRWETFKKRERAGSVLAGVPRAQPALSRAQRVQEKAAAVGFDWREIRPVWDKIGEEIQELREAHSGGDSNHVEEEFGDLLFALVNVARFLNLNAEDSLRKAVDKFTRRFETVEAHYEGKEADMLDASLEELDAIWDQVKAAEISREE